MGKLSDISNSDANFAKVFSWDNLVRWVLYIKTGGWQVSAIINLCHLTAVGWHGKAKEMFGQWVPKRETENVDDGSQDKGCTE